MRTHLSWLSRQANEVINDICRLQKASFCESLAAALAQLVQQKRGMESLRIMLRDKDILLKEDCNKINTFLKSAGEQLMIGWLVSIIIITFHLQVKGFVLP